MDGVDGVNYPWLPNSPYYELAKQQMRAGGGLISFQLRGGYDNATRFVDNLNLIPIATSYGGVESTIELMRQPKLYEQPASDAGLIRLSVGLEDVDELISDLLQAMETV